MLIFLYILGTIWVGLNFFTEKLHMFDARFVFNQFYWFDCSKYNSITYFAFYFVFYILLLGYAFIILLKNYRRSTGFKHQQLKYFILGSVIGWAGPQSMYLLTFGFRIYPYSNFLIMLAPSLWAYAILRHQLMDIRVVIKRTLIFAIVFVASYAILASFTLLIQSGTEKFLNVHKLAGTASLHTTDWPSVILLGLEINIFSIPSFIVAVFPLCLGFFVYYKNKKSNLNRIFSAECLTAFVWLFSFSVMYSCKNTETASLWARLGGASVVLIPVIFYHFTIVLLDIKNNKTFIKVIYVIGVLFVSLCLFTNEYMVGVNKFFWGFYPRMGKMYLVYFIFFQFIFLIALGLLFREVRSTTKSTQNKYKIKYVLLAFLVSLFASVDFLALFNIDIYPFGYAFIFVWFSITTYAIVRHHLLDIEVIIRKTLIFGGLFTIVYAVFAFFAVLGYVFFERFVTQSRWVSMIPSVLVVTIMLRSLENFLISVTDRFLFQKKYDYKELLKTFTSEVLTVLELDKLIQLTEDKLMEIMKLKSCKFIFEINSRKMGQSPSAFAKASADKSGTVPIFPASSCPRNDEGILELPIMIKSETVGKLVLGRKKSDEDYTQEDLDILQPLTKTLGIAISNAKLFEELAKTQATMAQKDKMATIGTLAAGMAHEIRNPLTTIRNFADYLPERCDDKNFMDKFDKLIPREIDRIESIARSLLEFSSTENTVKDEEFYIDEPVKTVISLLEPQYRASEIKIVCDFSKKHTIKGSKIQLQDIIFNIMNYIMAETPKGSSIIIECIAGEEEFKLCIRSKDLIMADHIIKDVFEPVSGLYKEKRGFGFNLFIAKELIERNGATLKISSDISNGAEFCIKF